MLKKADLRVSSDDRLKPVPLVINNLPRNGGTGFSLWKPFSASC